jgi:hypothetical protein
VSQFIDKLAALITESNDINKLTPADLPDKFEIVLLAEMSIADSDIIPGLKQFQPAQATLYNLNMITTISDHVNNIVHRLLDNGWPSALFRPDAITEIGYHNEAYNEQLEVLTSVFRGVGTEEVSLALTYPGIEYNHVVVHVPAQRGGIGYTSWFPADISRNLASFKTAATHVKSVMDDLMAGVIESANDPDQDKTKRMMKYFGYRNQRDSALCALVDGTIALLSGEYDYELNCYPHSDPIDQIAWYHKTIGYNGIFPY